MECHGVEVIACAAGEDTNAVDWTSDRLYVQTSADIPTRPSKLT